MSTAEQEQEQKPKVAHFMCHRCGQGGTQHNPVKLVMVTKDARGHYHDDYEHIYPCLDLWGITWEERNGLPKEEPEAGE